jgi:hypothetical protein
VSLPRRPPGFKSYAALWVLMMALHQDPWFAEDPRLVAGVLPADLAYQAGFSLLAAAVLALLVRVAWPAHLEALEERE